MKRAAALFFFLALPAMADTQFRARQMNRNDVPPGQGQCDIRLQVDGEVEVSVRGQTVFVRTISGREARDDGSECNAPLPEGNLRGLPSLLIQASFTVASQSNVSPLYMSCFMVMVTLVISVNSVRTSMTSPSRAGFL